MKANMDDDQKSVNEDALLLVSTSVEDLQSSLGSSLSNYSEAVIRRAIKICKRRGEKTKVHPGTPAEEDHR